MRIERINNNQIQVLFLAQDLADRNITVNDILTQQGGKTQDLFNEITQVLQREHDFFAGGSSLMFECRVAHNALCVIATRVDGQNGMLGGIPGQQNFGQIIGDLMTQMNGGGQFNHEMGPGNGMPNNGFISYHGQVPGNIPGGKPQKGHKSNCPKTRAAQNAPPAQAFEILSFPNFDMLAHAAAKIPDTFKGYSYVCKHDGKYFLVAESSAEEHYNVTGSMPYLCEYGTREPYSPVAAARLKERGEVVIVNDAVRKLKLYQG